MAYVHGLMGWDSDDREKVKHMLRRGKSIEFIHSYTGMEIEKIEQLKRNMPKQTGELKFNHLQDVSASSVREDGWISEEKQRLKLRAVNDQFVRALEVAARA